MKSLRTFFALAIAAGLVAAFSQGAFAAGKRHHKPITSNTQSKVEYLRAAGSPK
jgi:hypothetical protein